MNILNALCAAALVLVLGGCTDREVMKDEVGEQAALFAQSQHMNFKLMEKAQCKTLAVVAQDETDRFFESLVECTYTYSEEKLRSMNGFLDEYTRTKTYSVFIKMDGEDRIIQMPNPTEFKNELLTLAKDV